MGRAVRVEEAGAEMSEILEACGYTVEVTRRKNMRNVRLHVRADGTVGISAPYGVPQRTLEQAVERSAAWIARKREELADTPQARAETASTEEQRAWRAVVEAAVPLLLEKWEPVIGVRAKKLAYRNMKSRWGSCQPATGRVCINTRLALYPMECLEYVVVHELVHMLEPSHNARFKALMSEFLPDWKRRQQLLR